jgi:site-specific recombinase XerD
MGKLKDQMIKDMKLRGFAMRTRESYVSVAYQLARYFRKSPEELEEEDLRDYFVYLLEKRKLAPRSINVHKSGLRFLYEHTLQQPMMILREVKPAIPKDLPVVMNETEVRRALFQVRNRTYRTALSLIYGCGLRLGEGLRVEIGDIDGDLGRLHVRNGKGNKDRYALLPSRLHELLQQFWIDHRPSGVVLFQGKKGSGPAHPSTIRRAFYQACETAEITKKVKIHTLRHSYATHLLARGINIRVLQRSMGHRSLQSTERYAHITGDAESSARKVLDDLMSDL